MISMIFMHLQTDFGGGAPSSLTVVYSLRKPGLAKLAKKPEHGSNFYCFFIIEMYYFC
jgi:hypothetical protein